MRYALGGAEMGRCPCDQEDEVANEFSAEDLPLCNFSSPSASLSGRPPLPRDDVVDEPDPGRDEAFEKPAGIRREGVSRMLLPPGSTGMRSSYACLLMSSSVVGGGDGGGDGCGGCEGGSEEDAGLVNRDVERPDITK